MARELLRFKDLAARGIVKNWPQLKNLVDKHGFPAGFLIGEHSRAWYEDEIYAWLEQLPSLLSEKPPLRGGAKKRHEAKLAREAAGNVEAS